MKISPSILSVDSSSYQDVLKKLELIGVEYVHLDVMDGKFVSNVTYNAEGVKKINSLSKLKLDTHLMIDLPELYIDQYLNTNSDILTFHYESTINHLDVIRKIRTSHIKCGMAISPQTDPNVLLPFLPFLDIILIMSVEPGLGGQKFIDLSYEKIKQIQRMKEKYHFKFLIEVDGGIDDIISQKLKTMNVDIVVVGTYLMKCSNLEQTYKRLL